ncbi:MAG: hypothetical protein FJZ96_06840 [Chloroflexi bacterium]|nr:hypothetical protein [Chloroflexota bacterium]
MIDEDGNILYDNLTDLGEVQVDVEWVPDVPFIDGQATFHQYLTPSGNIVLLPSATTLFFMALNPEASGLNDAYGALGNGIGVLETMLAGYITPQDMADLGYTDSDAFWQAVIDGDVNIWTIEIMGDFLLDLLSSSIADGNLYTMLLLYMQGDCDAIPGGCPDIPEPTPTPPPNVCPPAFIETRPIQVTGGSSEGGKIAPPNPVVIGQDPERRGVDVQVNVLIPPVIYHYFRAIRHEDQVCVWDNSGTSSGCPEHPGDPYWQTEVNVWYECEEHTFTFPDYLSSARISVSLTEDSRNWILTDLAQAYPGAHLIHPDFSFSFPGPGSLLGDQSVTWTTTIPRIQTADPGEFETVVTVRTTGTPVSAPRQVQISLGTFSVELVEVILIEEP